MNNKWQARERKRREREDRGGSARERPESRVGSERSVPAAEAFVHDVNKVVQCCCQAGKCSWLGLSGGLMTMTMTWPSTCAHTHTHTHAHRYNLLLCATTKSRLHLALDRSYKLDCQCKRMFHAKVTTAPRRVKANDTHTKREKERRREGEQSNMKAAIIISFARLLQTISSLNFCTKRAKCN